MANNHHKRPSVTRLLTPVALAITLAACSSSPKTPQSVDILLDPSQPVETYLMRADSTTGSLQVDWLIMALKASVEAGDVVQSELLIKRLARQSLTPQQQAEWQLTRADLLISQGQHSDALSQLNFPASWSLPRQQWQEYYQKRAALQSKEGLYLDASRSLIAQSELLNASEQASIADGVWQNLSQYSLSELAKLRVAPNETVLTGWLELANDSKAFASNIPQLKSRLERWMASNPDHPAALYTPQALSDILALDITKPVNTALLLPLSGKFAKQAQLIRDGFIFNMMNDDARDENATLTVIDTNTLDMASLDATLIEKNIDFIVGPLLKENIEALQKAQQASAHSLPMLALNIPDETNLGHNTCYLALSPEQEVAQAAKHLFEQGARYPLILAPQGRLGERVVESFEQEWDKYSENKVAVSLFGDKRQLQKNINTIFGLQESQQNIAQMESLLNIPLETQPRSRRDVDAVYIVATSAEITLIKPFIEVAINPDTTPPALYSNSRSNSGQRQYEDLTGVSYSDIPLLIHPDAHLKQQMDSLWANSSHAEKRLQAMGMDAYTLMEMLPQMKVIEGYSVEGQTGILSIDEHCVVQREISWAQLGSAQ